MSALAGAELFESGNLVSVTPATGQGLAQNRGVCVCCPSDSTFIMVHLLPYLSPH